MSNEQCAMSNQAVGERLNAVCENYFARHPRDFDAPWPSSKCESDTKLASLLESLLQETRAEVVR